MSHVLGIAYQLGLEPVVYVSGELALLPPAEGEVLTSESPVKQPRCPDYRSNAGRSWVVKRPPPRY